MRYRSLVSDNIDECRQNIHNRINDDYWITRSKIYSPVSITVEIDLDEFECDRELIFTHALKGLWHEN